MKNSKTRGSPSVQSPGKIGGAQANRFLALSSPDFDDYEESFPSLSGATSRVLKREPRSLVQAGEDSRNSPQGRVLIEDDGRLEKPHPKGPKPGTSVVEEALRVRSNIKKMLRDKSLDEKLMNLCRSAKTALKADFHDFRNCPIPLIL
ncbi:hypothetical protein U1Q18_040105 [Sarracenia purpurea var. burkii]